MLQLRSYLSPNLRYPSSSSAGNHPCAGPLQANLRLKICEKTRQGQSPTPVCHSDEHTKKDTYNTRLATAVSSRTGIAARVLGLRQAHSMRIATSLPPTDGHKLLLPSCRIHRWWQRWWQASHAVRRDHALMVSWESLDWMLESAGAYSFG